MILIFICSILPWLEALALPKKQENNFYIKRSSKILRRAQFETSVLYNGYCGSNQEDANKKCFLCRNEEECSEGESCILLESCGKSLNYDEYQTEEHVEQQTGYCAPQWIDAAKCSYSEFVCSSDSDCGTNGHSCFFSIDWCEPGLELKTFFCATDTLSASQCELSKQCYSENDLCLNSDEKCTETDYCSVEPLETNPPTHIPSVVEISDTPTLVQSVPRIITNTPTIFFDSEKLPVEEEPANGNSERKVINSLLLSIVVCIILIAAFF